MSTDPQAAAPQRPAEMAKAYEHQQVEQRLYAWWERNDFFAPRADAPGPPFVIAIPPPNITGELHLGHAMFVTIEDLMIRWRRMQGYKTLWVPGTDHAGIATQTQVERLLISEGTSRQAVGREEFLRRTWEWKEKYDGEITRQLRRLGASCDWSRERFTLDAGLSRAVHTAFKRLYDDGLIYRGTYLVNWSPQLQTAVSDLEVEYEQRNVSIWYVRYPVVDTAWSGPQHPWGSGRWAEGARNWITVATTRPETILGDTAVAVAPDDERYTAMLGRQAVLPALARPIPIIADEYVDKEFGTGAVKITPAHDKNDYEVGKRHRLPLINIMNKDATINGEGGPYAGMDRFAARSAILADLEREGLLVKTEPHTMSVGISQRGGEVIEPLLSEQWFVRTRPLADLALAAVREGRTRIIPERFEKVYFHWLENIEDWCISRQLWWGHRIPVWYLPDGSRVVPEPDEAPPAGATQDPDVLDTWFSSGLWPFSTLGWPESTPDLREFYPTSVMETGYDILFFWVARMMMSGLEFTGQAPFHTIYLHGLIRDEHGQKMSKTKGNVIDPLIVMDELGTDALRFTLLVGSTPGKDTNLSLKKVEANRNFANKLWNAARLVIGLLQKAPAQPVSPEPKWTLADAFIFARLKALTRDVERLFQTFQYGQAGQMLYDFFWSDFADWYLEIAKLQIAAGGDHAFYTADLLTRVFETTLRLLHPFTPFVTEEIYGHLKKACNGHSEHLKPQDGRWSEVLMTARWPEPMRDEGWEEENLREFATFQEAVRAIRNLRAEKSVKPGLKLAAMVVEGKEREGLYDSLKSNLAALAGLDESRVRVVATLEEKPAGHIALVAGPLTIYLPLAEMSDPAEERARLTKELAESEAQIARLEKLLASDFAAKAPPQVVQKEREKLLLYQETAAKIRAQL